MKTSARALALMIVAPLAVSEIASAQAVTDKLGRWGLFGTWAIDCSQPPSRPNGYRTYVARKGQAYLERAFGDGQDSGSVLAAKIAVNNILELRVNLPSLSQTVEYSYLKGEDGQIRVMSTRFGDGRQTVKDGNFVSDGKPSIWQSRCR